MRGRPRLAESSNDEDDDQNLTVDELEADDEQETAVDSLVSIGKSIAKKRKLGPTQESDGEEDDFLKAVRVQRQDHFNLFERLWERMDVIDENISRVYDTTAGGRMDALEVENEKLTKLVGEQNLTIIELKKSVQSLRELVVLLQSDVNMVRLSLNKKQ
jgi:hypothetical protein